MEFGETLRAAREAKNYTVSQLAEITHIQPQVVEGLETENFSRIAAPIYGRGFVKLYAEAVGLDVKQTQQAFMEAYSGEPTAPAKAEIAEETSEPVTAPVPPAPKPEESFAESPSRYAAPTPSYGSWHQPLIPWRLVIVAAAGIAILLFAIFSVRFVWRQLSAPAAEENDATQVETSPKAETKPTTEKAVKRTPQNVKSLYID